MATFKIPSRADAWDLKRQERACMMFLMNSLSCLIDSKSELEERLKKVENGVERMNTLVDGGMKLLDEIRETIPEKQRLALNHTFHDYDMRMVPKAMPRSGNMVVKKEEFRELVNAAQMKCRECVEDSDGAKDCALYKLLTTVLPLEDYPDMGLCPYNMATWEN